MQPAGSASVAASCIGPIDKLRASSSARKKREPQDDKLRMVSLLYPATPSHSGMLRLVNNSQKLTHIVGSITRR